MRAVVILGKHARKQLPRVPRHVADKLAGWALLVEAKGLREARRVPGFHDEPLAGDRRGERSVRLSRAYRAIYTVSENGEVEIVTVEEVMKHDY